MTLREQLQANLPRTTTTKGKRFRSRLLGDANVDFNPVTGQTLDSHESKNIFPANIFITSKEKMKNSLFDIENDMFRQRDYFKEIGKHLEAKRLEDRVTYDVEMMRELGYCSGIENYSRKKDIP